MVIEMLKLPLEIQNLIYKFINPISEPPIMNSREQYLNWCSICGEHFEDNHFCIQVLINKQKRNICFNCFNSQRYINV